MCPAEHAAAHLAAEDSGYAVAQEGRRKVEINEGFGVVQSVMADLNRSQAA
jgi:hypothetical protein